MIEKNKFKEKILSEHTSSSDLKVTTLLDLVGSLCEKKAHIQEIVTKWRN